MGFVGVRGGGGGGIEGCGLGVWGWRGEDGMVYGENGENGGSGGVYVGRDWWKEGGKEKEKGLVSKRCGDLIYPSNIPYTQKESPASPHLRHSPHHPFQPFTTSSHHFTTSQPHHLISLHGLIFSCFMFCSFG